MRGPGIFFGVLISSQLSKRLDLERPHLSAPIITLFLTVFVGGLGLLAQIARKSRQAEVTLIVALLALSLLIATVGSLTGLALLLRAANVGATGIERFTFAAAGGAALVVGIAGCALCVPPL